jgi:chemosensory pili system protein ChpA (sensor histidine kinase/response regulator)
MPSVLVVDDNPAIALILSRHLIRAGYHVSVAHDGIDALRRIERIRPDVILLDLMMPVMTGVELLHALKHDPEHARIPIVLVSARVGEGRTHVVTERGADRSVGKPFTQQQVLAAVEAALRDSADSAAFAVA